MSGNTYNISHWILADIGQEEFQEKFVEHDISDEIVHLCTFESLREVIPGVGARLKFLDSLQRNCPTEQDCLYNSLQKATSSDVNSIENDGCGSVIMFIDNSNIWLGAKKLSAKLKKFPSNIKFDGRCRIDVGKMVAHAAKSRRILTCNLYGSEPPLLDSVWKSIREKKVNVQTSKRSPWTNREKEIDTTLVADAVENILNLKSAAGSDRTAVLFTGDMDMSVVAIKAIENGWKVEIWTLKSSISNAFLKKTKAFQKSLTVYYIDDIFDDVAYIESVWRKPVVPADRTIVLMLENFDAKNRKQTNATIRNIVLETTTILRLPTNAKVLPKRQDDTQTDTDGVFLCQNRFVVPEHKELDTLRRETSPFALVICQKEFQSHGKNHNTMDSNDNGVKVYDFNRDVWSQADNIKAAIRDCRGVITYPQYQQHVGIQEVLVDGVEELFDDDDPNFYAIDFDEFTVVERKQTKSSQKYSDPCTFRFRCHNGKHCFYDHSPLEKEYFKVELNPKKRFMYKTRQCLHPGCKYYDKKYLCSFAHGLKDARCSNCSKQGDHWSDECRLIKGE